MFLQKSTSTVSKSGKILSNNIINFSNLTLFFLKIMVLRNESTEFKII